MKKILIIAAVVAGLWWYGANGNIKDSAIEGNQSNTPDAQTEELAPESNEGEDLIDAGLKKASLLGTWYIKEAEADRVIAEIPDSEIPMAIRFDIGGKGKTTAGEDTCDISWSEADGIVNVTILLGGDNDVLIPLHYEDGELLWETDDSVLHFKK